MPTLKARALEKFEAYVGTVEATGNNDAPEINKAQRVFGYKVGTAQAEGDSYCVLFPMLMFLIALAERVGVDAKSEIALKGLLPQLRALMPVSAGVTDLIAQAKKRGVFLEADQGDQAVAGDLMLLDFTVDPAKIMRHCAMIRGPKVFNRKKQRWQRPTVEGNTVPDAIDTTNNARKQGGVWEKGRPLGEGRGYKVLGYVRTPE